MFRDLFVSDSSLIVFVDWIIINCIHKAVLWCFVLKMVPQLNKNVLLTLWKCFLLHWCLQRNPNQCQHQVLVQEEGSFIVCVCLAFSDTHISIPSEAFYYPRALSSFELSEAFHFLQAHPDAHCDISLELHVLFTLIYDQPSKGVSMLCE